MAGGKVVIDRDHRGFMCEACRKDIRIVKEKPTRPCAICSEFNWRELEGYDREKLFDELSPRSFEKARVFFCRRCEVDRRVKWDGSDIGPSPCHACGSRVFNELIGDAKEDFLKATELESGMI
jgi:hypothetical protein